MNCFIKKILVFGEGDQVRFVDLTSGLNIITGDSKTGKSALIEIVDYCLCSRVSNIPQGVISKFASLYCIVLSFPSKYVVLARKSYWQGGNTRMYIKTLVNEEDLYKLSISYFNSENEVLIKNAQVEVERHLGLSVRNMAESDDAVAREKTKASLRDMTSFFFQHQNLIASKHSLFYRFDDSRKRQATIDSFPVFNGWVDDSYYSKKRKLEEKEKELRQLLSRMKSDSKLLDEEQIQLRYHFKNYYTLIGKKFDDSLNFNALLSLKNELPDYTRQMYVGSNLDNRYSQLKAQRDENKRIINEFTNKIKALEESETYANSFGTGLSEIFQRSIHDHSSLKEYLCPVCGKEDDSLSDNSKAVIESSRKVSNELSRLSTYAVSYVKEIDELSKAREVLRVENSRLNSQIEDIEKKDELIKKDNNISNAVIYAKAQIDYRIELYNKYFNKHRENDSDSVPILRGEIEILKNEISQFNIERILFIEEQYISYNLDRIGEKLDFEEQLKPLNLSFNLKTFELTHNYVGTGLIGLSEMGSGANWLTCHLALFLSLLHSFASNEKSVVPSILFLDQPSQIYFPKEFDPSKDEDIKQVANIFITIIEELNQIENDTGFLPQVVVTDHADNLDLGKYNYNNYVRKRWINGEALI